MNPTLLRLPTVFLLALLITFVGCSKDEILDAPMEEITPESLFSQRMVDVTEHYDYYGEKFSVTYTLDQETEEVTAVSGDVDRARTLFTSKSFPKGSIVTAGNMDVDASTTIQLFDTQEEADALIGGDQKAGCAYSETQGGTAAFRFYEHSNYGNEFQDLTKPNRWLLRFNSVMSHNNDKISSISADGNRILKTFHPWDVRPWLVLYEDACFEGNYVTIYAQETRLEYVLMSPGNRWLYVYHEIRIPNLAAVSLYLGYWQGWTNWNDRVSSFAYRWIDNQ